jgi:hypothetical protein
MKYFSDFAIHSEDFSVRFSYSIETYATATG